MDKSLLDLRHGPVSMDTAIEMLAASAELLGEAVFPALVEGIAKSLGMQWVFLSRPSNNAPTQAHTIAVWHDGSAPNLSYELPGSPCAVVVGDGACCYPSDVQSLFPEDELLSQMGAVSYVGIPLRSSEGEVIGLLAALGDAPIENVKIAQDILALFAGRAASELERIDASSANERLGRIVDGSLSEAYVFDGDTYRFELVNRGARENLGYSLPELHALTPWDIKPEYSEAQFRQFVEPLKSGALPYLQFETVHKRKDGSLYDVHVRLQYFGGTDNIFFASIDDITERKMAEERERLLMREVNHRAKNLLSIIQVLARQTITPGSEDGIGRFEDRLGALSASYDLLVDSPRKGVKLKDLVHAQLGHFDHLFDTRIKVHGPVVCLKPSAAQSIGMALHELATNAAKYGSLSNESGEVDIRWSIKNGAEGAPTLTLRWTESGGPSTTPPSRTGFGSTLIESSLRASTRGQVELLFAESGVRFALRADLSAVSDGQITED